MESPKHPILDKIFVTAEAIDCLQVTTDMLAKSEERLQLATRAGNIGVWDWDVEKDELTWDGSMYALYGISKEDFPGTHEAWFNALHPEDRQFAEKETQAALRGEREYATEFRIVRLDGAIRTIKAVARTILGQNGRAIRLIGVNMDITERKRAEEMQHHSERQYRLLFESMHQGVILQAASGKIFSANARAEEILGRTLVELQGQTSADLEHYTLREDGAFFPGLEHPAMVALRTGQSVSDVRMGVYNHRENRYRWINISAVPMFHNVTDKEPSEVYAVFSDITERKAMEEKLLRIQRMESIGTLAAGIAHDLNNILTPIFLAAEVLHTSEQPETREGLLFTIEECARRGAAVVKQVLAFAHETKGEHAALLLNHFVDDMVKIGRETFPKNIAIKSSVPSDIWPVKGDLTQIYQVVLNLCINARDAMPEGGHLHISAENAAIDENFAAMVADAKVGDYAMLAVSDTGKGIAHEIALKIFDPFFTTKEVGKGTGLGLFTVAGIVRNHGGFITVKSEVGWGTTFKVFLPRDTEGTVEQKPLPPKEILLVGGGATILVVDDETCITTAIALVLGNKGYKVLTAADGNEALALYREHTNEIDLVLTDMIMPGMDGVTLSRALKEIDPRVKILASTGQASEPHQDELHALGVEVILHKPYSAKNLLVALHDAIHPVG